MGTQVQIISRHPIVETFLSQLLSNDSELQSIFSHPNPSAPQCEEHLCILDAWSVQDQLNELRRLWRMRFERAKFLALVSAQDSDNDHMLRLLYAGMDGVVKVEAQWQEELLVATRAILLEDKLWFPPQVIAEYVKTTNSLLEKQMQPDLALTPRENQVLQFIMRRLSNKEIGVTLGISERTTKFHVSNILTKMRVQTRRTLFQANEANLVRTAPHFDKILVAP
jgi:DNA-binding NarL/FixJ family response regulator